MTSQQLADELALIAFSAGITMRSHQILGSLDALEAFRRERLPGWEWWNVGWQQDRVEAGMVHRETARLIKKYGPDEWTARAAALIAAKETP